MPLPPALQPLGPLPPRLGAAVGWLPAKSGGSAAGVFDVTPEETDGGSVFWIEARSGAGRSYDDSLLEHSLLEAAGRVTPALATPEQTQLLRIPGGIDRFGVGHYRAVGRLLAPDAKRATGVIWSGAWTAAPHAEAAIGAGTRAARAFLNRG